MKSTGTITAAALALAFAAGCGGGARTGSGDTNDCDLAQPECDDGLVCAAVLDGDPRCVGPVTIHGLVIDIATDEPIGDARVQAVDVNGAAVGTSATTDSDGTYTITVPVLRDADDAPIDGTFTLRVQAAAYQEFPTPIRPALPLDAATATANETEDEGGWVIDNPLTTVKLISLPNDGSDLGSITGAVLAEPAAGVLVIAEGSSGAFTGFSDSEGQYVVFNVPAGDYSVRGFAAGLQVNDAPAVMGVGESLTGIDLTASDAPLSTISGSVQIVNPSGGKATSIVLAVESTFAEASGRGAVPPGLRVGDIQGAFTIENIPDGQYVVLAAFENDGLVRDPDQNIGGTEIVRITTPDPEAGNVITLAEGFKVTGALAVITPGADGPEQIESLTPSLEWEDDSSEDGYEIVVRDAFGNEVWSDEIGPQSGTATVTLPYNGPPLEPGMFYQFRVTSFREGTGGRTAISTTEDLKGVFFFLATP